MIVLLGFTSGLRRRLGSVLRGVVFLVSLLRQVFHDLVVIVWIETIGRMDFHWLRMHGDGDMRCVLLWTDFFIA